MTNIIIIDRKFKFENATYSKIYLFLKKKTNYG